MSALQKVGIVVGAGALGGSIALFVYVYLEYRDWRDSPLVVDDELLR